MPVAIQFFAQAITPRTQDWTAADQICQQFNHEGHCTSFMNTLVSYVMAGDWVEACWVDSCVSEALRFC